MNKLLGVLLSCLSTVGTAQAMLIDRGGGLIYDDVLNITWLQDANYGAGSIYDSSALGAGPNDGTMTWQAALDWAANLTYFDSVRGVTYDDWRLPSIKPLNGSFYDYGYAFNGTSDKGYNITSQVSELAYMYYVNLGNLGHYDTSGNIQGGWGLVDDPVISNDENLFINLLPEVYWSGDNSPMDTNRAWGFYMANGYQNPYDNAEPFGNVYAWAVRDGDVASNNIPEPSTALLMLVAGFGLIGLRARKQ